VLFRETPVACFSGYRFERKRRSTIPVILERSGDDKEASTALALNA